MISRARLESIVVSWDWPAAALLTLLVAFLLPTGASYATANGVFAVSISVLSIVFSVFFAALAILITAGDNEFVKFLERGGLYKEIVWTFRLTFSLLAIALVFAIVLYVTSLVGATAEPPPVYPRNLFILFGFVGLYSLLAAVNSSLDIIKYAEFRAKFLETQTDHKTTKPP